MDKCYICGFQEDLITTEDGHRVCFNHIFEHTAKQTCLQTAHELRQNIKEHRKLMLINAISLAINLSVVGNNIFNIFTNKYQSSIASGTIGILTGVAITIQFMAYHIYLKYKKSINIKESKRQLKEIEKILEHMEPDNKIPNS